MSKYESFLEQNKHTVVIIGVPESDEEPGFAYTVGFTHLFNRPELIIYGGQENYAEELLGLVAERFKENQTLFDETGVIVMFDTDFCLETVPKHLKEEYLRLACIKYNQNEFNAVRVKFWE